MSGVARMSSSGDMDFIQSHIESARTQLIAQLREKVEGNCYASHDYSEEVRTEACELCDNGNGIECRIRFHDFKHIKAVCWNCREVLSLLTEIEGA